MVATTIGCDGTSAACPEGCMTVDHTRESDIGCRRRLSRGPAGHSPGVDGALALPTGHYAARCRQGGEVGDAGSGPSKAGRRPVPRSGYVGRGGTNRCSPPGFLPRREQHQREPPFRRRSRGGYYLMPFIQVVKESPISFLWI